MGGHCIQVDPLMTWLLGSHHAMVISGAHCCAAFLTSNKCNDFTTKLVDKLSIHGPQFIVHPLYGWVIYIWKHFKFKRGVRDSGFTPLNGPEIQDSNFKQARIRDSNFIWAYSLNIETAPFNVAIQDSLYFWGWDSGFKFESKKNGWDSRFKFGLQGP